MKSMQGVKEAEAPEKIVVRSFQGNREDIYYSTGRLPVPVSAKVVLFHSGFVFVALVWWQSSRTFLLGL